MPASPSRSGNPAKKAAAKKAASPRPKAMVVSSADDWGTDETELVELPSEKVVRIERVPLTTLLAENLLGDSLSALASKAVEAGQGMDQSEINKMSKDPEKISEALDAMDKIAVRVIVEPEVAFYKDEKGVVIPREDRLSGVVYSDRISLEDKVFLFQVISGGTSDLQRFRNKLEESVAGVSAG